MTVEEFEASLARHCPGAAVAARVGTHVHPGLGEYYYDTLDDTKARQCYGWAVGSDARDLRTQAKHALVRMGKVGKRVRDRLIPLRRGTRPPPGPRGGQVRPFAR